MILVDTHCHLSDPKFDGDREAALERAWAAGLSGVVEIADTEAQWGPARALAAAHPGRVHWSAGFHPYESGKADPDLPRRLEAALADPRCVALGEVGLDYYKHCAVPRDVQRRVFETLSAVAVRADKPLVLHCREADAVSTDAQEDMLNILERVFPLPPRVGEGGPKDRVRGALSASDGTSSPLTPTLSHPTVGEGGKAVRGVAHCFQGTAAHARRFIELGFLVGIDAPLTYPKAQSLRDLVRALPLDALVLETDSPYLPPQDRRGGRNEPAFLPAVAEAAASAAGVSVEVLAETTTRNAARLYRFGT